MTKSQIIIISVVLGVGVIFALIFLGVLPGLRTEPIQSGVVGGAGGVKQPTMKLTLWGIGDSVDAYQPIFNGFKAARPDVEIVYRPFYNEPEYEMTLLEALAASSGPDIFMLRNGSLLKNINRIVPAPKTSWSPARLEQLFPQIVEQDFSSQGSIYALPLSIDTLALFYNRDLLDQAALTLPETWEEIKTIIPRLTALNAQQQLTRAGAALGGSAASIRSASDILMALMLQSGTRMTDAEIKSATFASAEGEAATTFYTQFADQKNDVFTWTDAFGFSLDVFANEKAALLFDYASAAPLIKEKNAFVRFNIASFPQPAAAVKAVAFADYWGYAVARQSKQQSLAWDFVTYMTTQAAGEYVKKAKKPPALRSLITAYLTDPMLGVFAKQALIARSWQQVDPRETRTIFSAMITSIISNQATIKTALSQAQGHVTKILQRKSF